MALAIRTWAKARAADRQSRRHRTLLAAGALVAVLLGQGGALAIKGSVPTLPAVAGGMMVGTVTSQPIGHYEFCRRSPAECAPLARDAGPLALTTERWLDIVEVNELVNAAVAPLTDYELHGTTELWSYPDAAGDCEDYVLLKRQMLMERGFDAADLLITVVRQRNGEGHAVLTVRTDHGDFILDNLAGEVRDWRETPYRYLKRQASHHAGRWVDIAEGQSPVSVGAVR